MIRDVFIIRHGLRADHEEYGEQKAKQLEIADPQLSITGEIQASCIERFLADKGISHIFCSPFLRCLQTAAPIAKSLKLKVKVEHGLSESYTEFTKPPQIMPLQEKEAMLGIVDFGYGSSLFPSFPETIEDTYNRCRIVRDLTESYDGNLCFITHEWIVCGAVRSLLGKNRQELDLSCRSGGIYQLNRGNSRGEAWSLVLRDHRVRALQNLPQTV